MWAQKRASTVDIERAHLNRILNRDAAFIAVQNGIEARELVEVEEAQAAIANDAHMRKHYSHISLARKPKSFGSRAALQGAANFAERSLLMQPSSSAQTANQREQGGGQEHESSDGSEEEEKEGKEKEGATASKAYLLPPRSLQPSTRSVRISSTNGPDVGAFRASTRRAMFAGPNESTSSDEAQASDTSPSGTALRKSGSGWFQVGLTLPQGSEDEAEEEDEEEAAEARRLARARSQTAEAARAHLRRMSVSSQLSAAVNSTKGGRSKSRRESLSVLEVPYQHKLLSRLEQRFSSSGYLPSTSSPFPSTSSLQGSTSGPKRQRNSQLSPPNGTLRGIAASGFPTLSRSSGQLPSHTSLLVGGPAAAEKGAQAGGLSRRARQTSASGVMLAAAADSGGRLREQDCLRSAAPDSPRSARSTAPDSPRSAPHTIPGPTSSTPYTDTLAAAGGCNAVPVAAAAAAHGAAVIARTSAPRVAAGGSVADVAARARPAMSALKVLLCQEQEAEGASSASASVSPLGRPFSPSPPAQGEPGMPRGRGGSGQLSRKSTSGLSSGSEGREGSAGGSGGLSERLLMLRAGGGMCGSLEAEQGKVLDWVMGGPPSVDGRIGASDEGLGAGDAAGGGGDEGGSDGDMYDASGEAAAPAPGSSSSQTAGASMRGNKLEQDFRGSEAIARTRMQGSSSNGCNPQLGVLSGVECPSFGKQLGLKAPILSAPVPAVSFVESVDAAPAMKLLASTISEAGSLPLENKEESQRPCLAPARPVSALKPRSWSQAPYTGSVFAAGIAKDVTRASLDVPLRLSPTSGPNPSPLSNSSSPQDTRMQPHPPPTSPHGKGGPIRNQSSLGQKPKPKMMDEGAPVANTCQPRSAHRRLPLKGKSLEAPTLSSLNAATIRQQQASIPPKPRSLSNSKARPLPPKAAPSASSSRGSATVLVVAPEAAQSAGSNLSAAAVPKRPQSSSSSGGSSKPCAGLQARTAGTTGVQAAGSQGGAAAAAAAAAVGAAAKRGGKPTLSLKAALGEAMASVLNPLRPLQRT